ncbi:hypothetical protein L1887_60695 [Cichorium endivia]|nr:hypothetical protein L1887_60695 [Cichorium endivia]
MAERGYTATGRPRALGVGVGCLGVGSFSDNFSTTTGPIEAPGTVPACCRRLLRTPPPTRPRTSSSPPPDHEAGASAPMPPRNHKSAPRGEGREAAKKFFWALGVENRALGVWDRALGAVTPIRATGVGGGVGVG